MQGLVALFVNLVFLILCHGVRSHELFTTEEERNRCLASFDSHGLSAFARCLSEKLNEWERIPVNIAVIGLSGSGKSTFMNTFRGLTADDPDAAETGETETTVIVPTPYYHPSNPLLTLWDLPEVGTRSNPKIWYLDKIDFSRYDVFLLLTNTRFTELDVRLANEITAHNKRVYFLRTKIHIDISNSKADHPQTHNKKQVVDKIRRDSLLKLRELETGQPQHVFLVDSHNRDKYEFELFEEYLVDSFPEIKQTTLIFSMVPFSKIVTQEKIKQFHQRLKYLSAVSALWAIVPVPIIGNVGNLALIATELKFYFTQLGLDDASLEKTAHFFSLSNSSGLKFIVHGSVFGFLRGDISVDSMKRALPTLFITVPVLVSSMAAEEILRYVPLLGSVAAGGLSAAATAYTLNHFLNEMEGLANEVIEKAISLRTVQ